MSKLWRDLASEIVCFEVKKGWMCERKECGYIGVTVEWLSKRHGWFSRLPRFLKVPISDTILPPILLPETSMYIICSPIPANAISWGSVPLSRLLGRLISDTVLLSLHDMPNQLHSCCLLVQPVLTFQSSSGVVLRYRVINPNLDKNWKIISTQCSVANIKHVDLPYLWRMLNGSKSS